MKLSLKYLILFIALLSVALTLTSSILSGYRVSQDALIENTLETNQVYAQKVAHTTGNFLNEAMDTLAYSANNIATYLEEGDEELIFEEADRLLDQMNTFNSIVFVSDTGLIRASSPETLGMVGEMIDSEGGLQALDVKEPFISKPYLSMTDRLIVLISQPVFNDEGIYKGYISGSIYLLEDNVLNDLLGAHFFQDDSYFYVVDIEGNILYHPDLARINENVADNLAVQEAISQKDGSVELVNAKGIGMLAGYANVEKANWGVVSQTEKADAIAPASEMRDEMLLKALPFILLSSVLIILLANQISQPLHKLGNYAERSTEEHHLDEVTGVRAWYYEAIQLENALVKSFQSWEERVNYFIYQSTTDPLTGLANRRFMDETIKKWGDKNIPYALTLIDVDRFKLVNDTYGHAIGDDVLKFLATEMQNAVDETALCCRYGGEEFVILLPNTGMNVAYNLANELRKKVVNTVSPTGKNITISGGVAHYPHSADHFVKTFELADQRLYQAKEAGRNKIIGEEL